MNLLEVRNLRTQYQTDQGSIFPVDDISFTLKKGKTLGLVGESGSGKSVTALSIMGLIQKPGRIFGGEILFEEKNLLSLSQSQMQKLRGRQIAMIFQEPMSALNPLFSVGSQVAEAIEVHNGHLSNKEIRNRALEMLKKVGIPAPENRYHDYPHQLSGGMRQRVMIAMAMSCNPSLLIADEPTTALDVTIQAQILSLMRDLQKSYETGLLLITHDLGVVAEVCEEVAVMYAGRIVEYGTVEDIFYRPKHPYTRGLLQSLPNAHNERLHAISGLVPSFTNLPDGCRFSPRCSWGQKQRDFSLCQKTYPSTENLRGLHKVACHYPLPKQEPEVRKEVT